MVASLRNAHGSAPAVRACRLVHVRPARRAAAPLRRVVVPAPRVVVPAPRAAVPAPRAAVPARPAGAPLPCRSAAAHPPELPTVTTDLPAPDTRRPTAAAPDRGSGTA